MENNLMDNQVIEWPEEFSANDSEAWRNIEDYDKRMEMIAFFCSQNSVILKAKE